MKSNSELYHYHLTSPSSRPVKVNGSVRDCGSRYCRERGTGGPTLKSAVEDLLYAYMGGHITASEDGKVVIEKLRKAAYES